MGNIGSVVNMLRRIEAECVVANDLCTLKKARKIILPGVGAFDAAMSNINRCGFRETLEKKVISEQIPLLGICLGMQLLTRRSEEGSLPGFGWIQAETRKLPDKIGLKVPHMGWNVTKRTKRSLLTEGISGEIRFYFVHSYCVHTDSPLDTILQTSYGIDFAAAIQHENIMGVQFHPEKSHRFGKKLLENFAKNIC